MVRWNDREGHTYVIGVYDDEVTALTEAWEHMKYRGGKYGAEVCGWELSTKEKMGTKVYTRKLDCWDAFAESCTELAHEIKERLEKE